MAEKRSRGALIGLPAEIIVLPFLLSYLNELEIQYKEKEVGLLGMYSFIPVHSILSGKQLVHQDSVYSRLSSTLLPLSFLKPHLPTLTWGCIFALCLQYCHVKETFRNEHCNEFTAHVQYLIRRWKKNRWKSSIFENTVRSLVTIYIFSTFSFEF